MRNILFLLLTMTVLFAEIKVGEKLPQLTLIDQHDQNISINNDTIVLLFSFQKDVSTDIQTFIKSKKERFLEKNNILYIADISSIPSFLVSLFALPKMKKFSFNVALIYDRKVANMIPKEEDKVTLIKLNNQKILSIEFIEPRELGNSVAK